MQEIWGHFYASIAQDKINLILFSWCIGLLSFLLFSYFSQPRHIATLPTQHPKIPIYRYLTLEELSEYNGEKNPDIFICVDGLIYDVTRSKQFYGTDGPYSVFAGRDCTVMLAKQSLDPSDVTKRADLKPFEQENLRDWKIQIQQKYLCIGELKK